MAVVSHHGESFDTGHYTAFVRYQSPNPYAANTHVWYECNDTEVKKVQQKIVLEDDQGYLFFYSRRTDQLRREIFRVVRSTGNTGEQPALQPASSLLRSSSRVPPCVRPEMAADPSSINLSDDDEPVIFAHLSESQREGEKTPPPSP